MSNRWLVYREKETLGPFETHEVRAALRSGDLDPFDKVGIEGSSIQRPLIDIDEIFIVEEEVEQEAEKQVKKKVRPARSKKKTAQQVAVSGSDIQQQFVQEADLRSSSKTQIGRGYVGGAIEEIKDGNKDDVSEFVKKYKSYYVMSGNNIGGPYSYQKIVELYKKGTFPHDARVKKNGYSKAVSLRSFVKKAPRKKKGNSHSANIIALQNNKRRLIIVKEDNKAIQWIAIAVVIVSLVVAAMTMMNHDRRQQPGVSLPPAYTNNNPVKIAPRAQPTVRKKRVARKSPIKVKRIAKVASKPRRKYIKPTPRTARKTTPKKVVRRSVAVKKPKTVRRSTKKPAVSRTPTRRRVTAQKPSKVNRSSLSSLPNLAGREGDEVTIGPLAFSPSQLQGCANKCTLNFADRNAKSISVIFFKGAYLSKLVSKKGAAILQGTVSNGGNALILQNVR